VLLKPVFDMPEESGSLLEMSFAGGHGTIAGMGQLFEDEGVGELVDIGLGLATISMVTGVVAGSALGRWAIRSPHVEVRRHEPLGPEERYDVDDIHVVPADETPPAQDGLHRTTTAFALIGVAILLSVAILWSARAVVSALGSDVLDTFPLFPVAVIGGFVVQWAVTRTGQAHIVDKRAVEGISSIALDVLRSARSGRCRCRRSAPMSPRSSCSR
jgi:ESS family glutamate:Na+ symporter